MEDLVPAVVARQCAWIGFGLGLAIGFGLALLVVAWVRAFKAGKINAYDADAPWQ